MSLTLQGNRKRTSPNEFSQQMNERSQYTFHLKDNGHNNETITGE